MFKMTQNKHSYLITLTNLIIDQIFNRLNRKKLLNRDVDIYEVYF